MSMWIMLVPVIIQLSQKSSGQIFDQGLCEGPHITAWVQKKQQPAGWKWNPQCSAARSEWRTETIRSHAMPSKMVMPVMLCLCHSLQFGIHVPSFGICLTSPCGPSFCDRWAVETSEFRSQQRSANIWRNREPPPTSSQSRVGNLNAQCPIHLCRIKIKTSYFEGFEIWRIFKLRIYKIYKLIVSSALTPG